MTPRKRIEPPEDSEAEREIERLLAEKEFDENDEDYEGDEE